MRVFASILTSCFLLLGFGTVHAQEDRVTATFNAGVNLPVGGVAQFTSTGTAMSLELSYGVSPRTNLWSGWTVTEVDGLGIGPFPRETLSDVGVLTKHFLVGADVEVTDPDAPVRIAGLAGAGVGMVSSDPFLAERPHRLEREYPTATVGVEASYDLFGFLSPYVRSQLFGAFAPDRHSALFEGVHGFEDPFGSYVSWAPAVLGLQLEF